MTTDGPGADAFAPERLLAEAERRNGLTDWGGDDLLEATFRKLFTALCVSLETEAQLNARGSHAASLRLEALVDARLWFVEDRKARPAVASERIVRPIFVLGLPRTGSSFLQAVLAQDPANAWTSSAELMFPAPMPNESDGGAARRARAHVVMQAMGMFDPDVNVFHPWSDNQPEECHFACELMAWSEQWASSWRIPGYNKLRPGTARDSFRTHKLVLQTLQHGNGKDRFALKSPGHLFRLPELLAMYPDALIVQTHHDPAKVLPSMTAFVCALRRVGSDEPIPADKIAATNLKAFAPLLESVIEFRAGSPFTDQFFDAQFVDIVADPIQTIERIYEHFRIEFTSDARAAMRAWIDDPANNTPRGRSSLADFGIDERLIDEKFGHYLDYYGIARELVS